MIRRLPKDVASYLYDFLGIRVKINLCLTCKDLYVYISLTRGLEVNFAVMDRHSRILKGVVPKDTIDIKFVDRKAANIRRIVMNIMNITALYMYFSNARDILLVELDQHKFYFELMKDTMINSSRITSSLPTGATSTYDRLDGIDIQSLIRTIIARANARHIREKNCTYKVDFDRTFRFNSREFVRIAAF